MKKSNWIAMALAAAISISQSASALAAQTTLEIYNASNNPVKVYLTLDPASPPNPGYIQTVQNLPWRHAVNMTTVTTLQGWFKLRNGDTASLTTSPGQAIAGKFTFVDAPASGITEAKFKLNNNTPAFGSDDKENAAINTTPGVNARMRYDLNPAWPSTIQPVSGFENTKNGVVSPVASVERPATTSGGTVKLTFLKSTN